MSSRYFTSRAPSRNSGLTRNGWRMPTGDELQNEIELIKQKESKLSSFQRVCIILAHKSKFLNQKTL